MDLHCLAIPTDNTTLWWQYCGSSLLDLVAMMQNFLTPENNEITNCLCPCTQKHLMSVFLDSDHLKFANGPCPVHVQCCVNVVGSLYQSAVIQHITSLSGHFPYSTGIHILDLQQFLAELHELWSAVSDFLSQWFTSLAMPVTTIWNFCFSM